MATRRDSGGRRTRAPGRNQPETPEPPTQAFEQLASKHAEALPVEEDEDFEDPDDKFDPEKEPVSSNPEENLAAAVSHLETAITTLGKIYSSSVVLRLALQGQNVEQDDKIEECLNRQVSVELDRVVNGLVRAARRLGSNIENPMP